MQNLNDQAGKNQVIEHASVHLCKECQLRPAEIFQINGDYCLECWQIITHTNS
jgi:hypothetical protein